MKVYHLNCATMNPPLAGRIVCHVLLCEQPNGLVLVDTGFGTADIADPARRIGPARHGLRPRLDVAETALHQVRALGFDPADVRDIVLTHLDFDHIGGLSDFPDALVHTTAAEHHAAMVAPSMQERLRYRAAQWAHGPRMKTYDGPGQPWRGFASAHQLAGIDDGIALIPMAGHTRGHAVIAVDAGDEGLLVHAGDAAFDGSSIDGLAADGAALAPWPTLRRFEKAVGLQRGKIAGNHARLAALRHELGARVFTAHDSRQL